MSMQMIKIHGVEDHLFDQIKYYNWIGCFIEDFIEQAQQFGNLDESRTSKLRDQGKAYNHSFNVRMDRFKWKCNKKTIEVKERLKKRMKDPNKFVSRKKQDRVKDN